MKERDHTTVCADMAEVLGVSLFSSRSSDGGPIR